MRAHSWTGTAKWEGLCIMPIIFVAVVLVIVTSGGSGLLQFSDYYDYPLVEEPPLSSDAVNEPDLNFDNLPISNSSREKSPFSSSLSSSSVSSSEPEDLLPPSSESSSSSSQPVEWQRRDYHLELPTSSPTPHANFEKREGKELEEEEGLRDQGTTHSLPNLTERIRSEVACYDASCVHLAAPPENKTVAFALYGGAFRTGTTGGGVGYSCNKNSYEVQRAIYKSHVANVLRQFQKLDYSVDIFLIPYPCYNDNNQTYTESLSSWYAPVAFKVYNKHMPTEEGLVRAKSTNAVTSVDRRNGVIVEAIDMIAAHETVTSSSYNLVLLMRLDTMIGSPISDFLETKFSEFDQNSFTSGKPQVYHMENMQLLPRCMLSCMRRLFKELCIQVDYGSICGSTMNEAGHSLFFRIFTVQVCHLREGNVYYPMVNFEEEQKAAGINLEAGRFWLLTNQARGSNPQNESAKGFPRRLSELVQKISKDNETSLS